MTKQKHVLAERAKVPVIQFKQQVIVKNPMGLHTRPATSIVRLLQGSKSRVSFTCERQTINAKSIMSILMLAARKDTKITITAEGEDAQETMDRLTQAFDNQFGE